MGDTQNVPSQEGNEKTLREKAERRRSIPVLGVTKTEGQEKVHEEDTTYGDGHKNRET